MTANTDSPDAEPERPDPVPDHFEEAPASECGYAVSGGDLWVERIGTDEETGEPEYGTEFLLRVVPRARDVASGAIIITRAARACPDVPTSVKETTETHGFIRGDVSDLDALTTALKHYERHEAGFGEDKFAYEMRTALNHAKAGLRGRTFGR